MITMAVGVLSAIRTSSVNERTAPWAKDCRQCIYSPHSLSPAAATKLQHSGVIGIFALPPTVMLMGPSMSVKSPRRHHPADSSFSGWLLFDHTGFYVRNLAVDELVCQEPLLIEAFDLPQPPLDR